MKPFRSKEIDQILFLFVFFFLASCITALVHFSDESNLQIVVMRLPFLAILPVISVLALTPPNLLIRSLELGAAIGAVLTAIVMVVGFEFTGFRATVGAGNPGPFALVMSVSYAVCILAMFRQSAKGYQLLHLAGVIAALLCVIFSGMRSFWIFLLIAPLIGFWARDDNHPKIVKLPMIPVAGVIFGIVLFSMFFGAEFSNRLTMLAIDAENIEQNSNFKNSLGNRLIMWDYALSTMPNSIWFGLGLNESLTGMKNFSISQYGFPVGKTHFHNVFIDSIMKGGLINLVATIGILFGPTLIAWRSLSKGASRYGFALMLSISIVYILSGLFGISLGHDIQDHLFIYMMAASTYLVFATHNADTERPN